MEQVRVELALFFFFNDTATTEIYTLSLHDALPICCKGPRNRRWRRSCRPGCRDRKSTRLNSSHLGISYAVFCLKKKKRRSAHDRGNALASTSTLTPLAVTAP